MLKQTQALTCTDRSMMCKGYKSPQYHTRGPKLYKLGH